MIVDVEVPNQGLTITEATLIQWHRQPGETIQKGDILFEIETDKAVQEIEAPADGTVLALLAQEGEVVPLGRVVAQIGTEASDRAAASANGAGPTAAQSPVAVAAVTFASASPVVTSRVRGEGVVVSPRARRTAARLGVDMAAVNPTGAHGRHIREKDVLRAAQEQATAPLLVSAPAPSSISVPTPSRTTPILPGRFRQITARRTAESFRDTPHFYLTREVQADRFVVVREEMVTAVEAQTGVRISVTDLLLKALVLALRAFPTLNAQWSEAGIFSLQDVDIGLAVETPEGLIVPVLRAVDTLSLVALARSRQALVQRAREGKCRPEDLTGGSFTLSNLGTYGVDQFEAIIIPPQSGILAVGAIKSRPFVVEETLTVSKTLFLTLSADHRVVDGAEAARFLDHLTQLIERPLLLCAL
jgi:pyruvate dehydrogenase E2 component (dihydrolipoamide acetyltransferase)